MSRTSLNPCMPFSSPSPLAHSYALLLDHQQGPAWGSSSSWVSSSCITSEGANHLMSSEPRKGLCGMLHITSIGSPEADRVTEQCSGNITKTLLNFCLSFSLPARPFIFPSLSLLVCPLCSIPPSHPIPPPTSQSQLSVLPKSNSCEVR